MALQRRKWTGREKRVGLIILGLAVLLIGGAALIGSGGESASEKCDQKYGYGSARCLEVAENELKAAEYGSVRNAKRAEHIEEVESEAAEVEEVLKRRQAEHIASELEGAR